jgi:hypothetical protein
MKTRFVATWLAVTLIAGIAQAADDTKSDPREKIETAVPEAIRLLEKKEHQTFLKQFIPPQTLEKLAKNPDFTLEKFAERFADKKADRLLEVLKQIEKVDPILEDDGKTAAFALAKPVGSKKSIKFKKIGKYWYIGN